MYKALKTQEWDAKNERRNEEQNAKHTSARLKNVQKEPNARRLKK